MSDVDPLPCPKNIPGWTWDGRFKLFDRDFGWVRGCVSVKLASGGYLAAYDGNALGYYASGLRDTFEDPAEAAGAVEAFARSRGWVTSPPPLPGSTLTREELLVELATTQERYSRAWTALCDIGEQTTAAGHYVLTPERALRVPDAVRSLITEREDRRAALVAALHLPAETPWEAALAQVTSPMPAAPPEVKGCHGCGFGSVSECHSPYSGVKTWIIEHLSNDHMTPRPGAPECPGRSSRSE